jgi:hypothetical protein
MTNNPAAPARDGNPIAQYGKRDRPPMGREAHDDDPERRLREDYNLCMRELERDAGLWADKARGFAHKWLERNSCIAPYVKGEIVMGVQKLNHPHTQAGFLEYMRDIAREWESRKELAATMSAKPRLIPDEKPAPREVSKSPFGPKPLSPEVQKKLEEDKVKTMEQIAAREREKQAQAALQSQLASAADDPNPTPSPDEPEKLADHFPRTVTGEPMPDKALINGKHWQKDSAARSKFFADYTGLCNKHQVPVADHTREKIRAAAQGTEHLEQYPGTPDELFAACKARVEAEYPLKPSNDEIAPKKAAVENQAPTTPTNSVPTKIDAESGTNSGNEIKLLMETISALQKKINELEAKEKPAKMNNPELPEAPFSANFHLRNKRGVRIQYTIRAQTVQDGTERVDALIDILLEKRGFALDELPATRATASSGTPAPASAESGSSLCALIKVGKSYSGNKAQLQFECDGFNEPLRYTRDNLAQILANAKQMNGNPFTSNDLTDGRKFGGEWMVDWQKAPGSDGKNHINVIAVRNAA